MDPNVSEWLNLVLRWVHVLAAIMWVGQTYFFTWLDGQIGVPQSNPGESSAERLYMVHSGGFYQVEKQTSVPEAVLRRLHWFRWEAAFTWISGFLLLGIVYYMGGALIEYGSEITVGAATAISLGVLILGWVVYDVLWISRLGSREWLGTTISFVLLIGVGYGLTQVLSGRAAYIHVGALMGTIMAANVWMRILPAQRQMISAIQQGKDPDATLAAQAKLRSKQNTYMSIPVVFFMISHHFPTASYGHQYEWLMMGLFILAGWGARKVVL